MFDYLNIVYWVIALAALLGWARFVTFVAEDVSKNLVDLPELPWQVGYSASILAMFAVFIVVPNFWLAFTINAVIAGGGLGLFWWKRVQILGSAGHLFAGTIASVKGASGKLEERRNARQVQLSYFRHDNSAMLLPKADDPLAAGLSTADHMIINALMRRAQLIDLIPGEGGYALVMSVDGFPSHLPVIPRNEAEAAIQAFKIMGGLSVDERRRPQTGKFKSRDAEGVGTTWTVRSSGSTAGEKLNLSANEKGQWDLRLDGLGLNADQLTDLKTLTADTRGTVIIAAPRGHGRTSTMYALLRQHDAFTNSVQTLELNPQAELEGVTFNTFDTRNAEVSYAKALSSIMLKDPNVVLSAQLPDIQTADAITKFAVDDAGNGHRVYVGMPAPDSLAALDLWLSLNTEKTDAINSLRAIIAQRLVRILCPTCKIPYQPDEQTLKRLNLPVGRNLQSFKANTGAILDKKGNKITCPDCAGAGFKGRTGIFEVLIINDDIRKAVAGKANHSQIKGIARKANFSLLVESGIRKFATGITAINEVTRVLGDKPPPAGQSGVHPSQK